MKPKPGKVLWGRDFVMVLNRKGQAVRHYGGSILDDYRFWPFTIAGVIGVIITCALLLGFGGV